jgi:hypothetical protein
MEERQEETGRRYSQSEVMRKIKYIYSEDIINEK